MKRSIPALLAVSLLIPLPTAAANDDAETTGTWFDGLHAGVCFDDVYLPSGDFDFTVPAATVACEDPHQNEVVARVSLGEGDYPTGDIVATVNEACAPEYEAFLGRPIEASVMAAFNVAPDEEDWAAGVREGLCTTYSGDSVRGTAAGGTLRAPGERLAVYREIEQQADIWLVDAGTGEAVRNITDNDLTPLLAAPGWSADASRITFGVQVGASTKESDIYVVSLDDGTITVLVEGPASEDGAAFSPDGSTIAYISNEDADEFEIYTRDLESGETTRVTNFADRDSSPQWSPDGAHIAFRRRTDTVSDIWVMNADGSDVRRLTDNCGSNYDPRWSPDGTRIAFTTKQADNFDIGVMNADGSEQMLLTTHPADDEFPTWSNDGRVIAFHSTRHGGVTLWLMKSDGSEPSELTGLAPMGYPMFAPAPVE